VCLAFSPDGRRLAVCAADALEPTAPRTIGMWDVQTGQLLYSCRGHSAPVATLAFSPDGKRLASASLDVNRLTGEVKLWETTKGTEVLTLPGFQAVTFSSDGRLLAAVGGDGLHPSMIQVWEGQLP
jgi:WD40 repeat protein